MTRTNRIHPFGALLSAAALLPLAAAPALAQYGQGYGNGYSWPSGATQQGGASPVPDVSTPRGGVGPAIRYSPVNGQPYCSTPNVPEWCQVR